MLRMLLKDNTKIFKEVVSMTLNLFFLLITFKKREVSLEEVARQELIENLYEQNKDRQISMHRLM
jgi:uncharacterized protein (TIGR02413 family)